MIRVFKHNFKFKGQKLGILIEKYSELSTITHQDKKNLDKDITLLLENCWGRFPKDFIDKHIFSADRIIIARLNATCIGLCVMSNRDILNHQIHYIEFLLVNRQFQSYGLGLFLSFEMIKDEILKNVYLILLGESLEISFITPNIRVLSSMTRFASFIYPNLNLADHQGKIALADLETWEIATELLKRSDNPDRKLEREGLVLKGSYLNTPWLIYNNDTAPWHFNEKVNVFAKRYLCYHIGEDREFMVRAKINLSSLIKYALFSLKK